MISKVLVAFVMCLFLYVLWKRRKYYLLCLKVPGPLGYPLLGMAHLFIKKKYTLKNMEKLEKIYGTFFFSWLGPYPIFIVTEPQIVQEVLSSPHCVDKGFMYEGFNKGAGRGLFGLNEPDWSLHRKILNPAFHYNALMDLIPLFNAKNGKLLELLGKKCGKGEINLIKILQQFTLSLATKTIMDEDLIIEDSYTVKLLETYQCLSELSTKMCMKPWLKIKLVRWLFGIQAPYVRAKTAVRLFVKNAISKKLENESIGDGSEFLRLAIESMRKGNFTYKNVEDEVNIFVFAAFDTTANTIGYTLLLLAMFPTQQQKLFEEIKPIFPDSGDFEVTMSDIQQLVFLDMVINEGMRLMAPIPFVARRVSKEVTLSNGVTIPAGVDIAIDIFNMHRRKDVWGPDAHKFNPENFLPTNLEDKHSYAFIPFTKGMRNCIGSRYALLSVKIALIKLIRNYEFKTSSNFEELIFVENLTLKLKPNPMLELCRRNS